MRAAAAWSVIDMVTVAKSCLRDPILPHPTKPPLYCPPPFVYVSATRGINWRKRRLEAGKGVSRRRAQDVPAAAICRLARCGGTKRLSPIISAVKASKSRDSATTAKRAHKSGAPNAGARAKRQKFTATEENQRNAARKKGGHLAAPAQRSSVRCALRASLVSNAKQQVANDESRC